MGSDRCPFCVRIARGNDPRHGKDQLTASFEPLNPVTHGHRLFVPTAHYERSPQALGRAVEAAQRYGLAHYKELEWQLTESDAPVNESMVLDKLQYRLGQLRDELNRPAPLCAPLAVGQVVDVLCECGHVRYIHRADGQCPSCALTGGAQ